MDRDFLFALWYFIPAGIANVTPIIAAKTPGLKRFDAPVDSGRRWRGKRIFDDHKTWRGIVTGCVAGVLVLWLQASIYQNSEGIRLISQPLDYSHVSIIGLGLLLSLGALGGDLLKSFAKRQFNVRAGHSWFPFDQLDYIIGGLALSSLYIQLSLVHYVWVIIVWFGMHVLSSYVGYLTGFKDSPI
jgi:CDP-2,3-bis-(O-geranylgeranyl)-sn-glycerol synthase